MTEKKREVYGIPVPPEFHAEFDEMEARHARERAATERAIQRADAALFLLYGLTGATVLFGVGATLFAIWFR